MQRKLSKKQPKQPKQAKDQYMAYVSKLCEYFRLAVFAGEYRMEVSPDCQLEEKDGGRALASIHIDTTYLALEVRLSKDLREMFDEGKFQEVASTICHEFCHVLTEPLYVLAIADAAPSQLREIESVRERQTERVSASLFRLVPQGVWMRRQRKAKGR